MPDGGPLGPASVILFGLFSAAAWGTSDFAAGLASRRVSVLALVLAAQTVGMTVALGLAMLRAEPVPAPMDVLWSGLAGVLGTGAIVALYAGLAVGRMGVVAPVAGVIGALVPVAVGIALEGLPAGIVLVGMAAAVVAVVLVSRVGGEAGARSGIELGLLAGLGIGLFNVTITRVDEGLVFGPLTIVRVAALVVLALALLARRQRVALPARLAPAIVAIGLLDMAANAGFLLAEQTGSLAVAAVLSSLYPVITVILATIVLRERVTRSHAAGIALALLAIVLIATGST
ncbi:MAG: EamA family transporter [Chloroflexi bacterium]|nr:EamA family transporter [Chloroflexota bacterium]